MTTARVETTIEIDDHELDNRIIEAAADNLLGQLNLTARYGGAIPDMINEKINEIIAAKVSDILAKPIKITDQFGDPTGEVTTLAERIAKDAEAALEQRVEMFEGRPTRERNPFHGGGTRLEFILKKIVEAGVETEARKVAEKVNKEAKAHAEKVLASAVAAQLARMAK